MVTDGAKTAGFAGTLIREGPQSTGQPLRAGAVAQSARNEPTEAQRRPAAERLLKSTTRGYANSFWWMVHAPLHISAESQARAVVRSNVHYGQEHGGSIEGVMYSRPGRVAGTLPRSRN